MYQHLFTILASHKKRSYSRCVTVTDFYGWLHERQDEPNLVLWLANQVGKMLLSCPRDYPLYPARK